MHEQVRHVPALQIAVEHAGLGIGAHDGAAVEMRGLVGRDVVGPLRGFLSIVCAPIALTISAYLSVMIGRRLQLVVVEVDRHPHQRPAEAVLVGRIEIEIDVAIAVEAAVDAAALQTC